MNKQKKLRSALRSHLGTIVETFQFINGELKDLPHENGSLHKSLNPKKEEYIVHRPGFICSDYRHSDGKLYTIMIKETCEEKK
ncbi:MAG: hypothetical protein AABX16_01710 [Nanoarchaeota archaeon]